VCRGGVGPGIGERFELRASVGDLVEHVEQITGRTRQTIKAGDQQGVAGFQPFEELGEYRAISLRAAGSLSIDLGSTGLGKLGVLVDQGLASGTDAGVAVDGHLAISF